jgi:hypothetical protein
LTWYLRPRRILLGAFTLVLAVLVSGVATFPAHAADNSQRPKAISDANDFIGDCIANGGEPDIETVEVEGGERVGYTSVLCFNAEAETADFCDFNYDGTTNCGPVPELITQPLPGLRTCAASSVYCR